jgi:hypothetical protein
MQKMGLSVMYFLSLFAVHSAINLVGTDELSDDRYYLNTSGYSSTYGISKDKPNISLMRKTLVSLAVENALLTIGKGTHATTINHLRTMCNNSSLQDCLAHPEYLNTVLKTNGNDIYQSTLHLIKTRLKELENDKEISEFLIKLDK